MQITSNRRLLFEDYVYTTNPDTKEVQATVKASIIVNANPHPQIVPDWVRKTRLFELCVEDGNVSEVSVLSAPAKPLKKPGSDIKFQATKIPEAVVVVPGEAKAADGKKAAWPATSADIGQLS